MILYQTFLETVDSFFKSKVSKYFITTCCMRSVGNYRKYMLQNHDVVRTIEGLGGLRVTLYVYKDTMQYIVACKIK